MVNRLLFKSNLFIVFRSVEVRFNRLFSEKKFKPKKQLDQRFVDRLEFRQRQIKNQILSKMSKENKEIDVVLAPLRASVKEQGDLVRSLKESCANDIDILKAVNELKARKKLLEDRELEFIPRDTGFERARLEDLIKRRFFVDQSFSIYGGVSGQYDFGPMGCAMKQNLLSYWRNHFVLDENLLEVDCTILTPEPVLQASGHVERFADLMVKDVKNGECFRLDHLIKAHLEKLKQGKNVDQKKKDEYDDVIVRLDGYSKDELNEILRKYEIKSPVSGNDLSEAIEFNLMFSTSIGPTGHLKAFLRPETAQGIFVNFKRLLEFNQGRLPFGASQIGNAFRNEISPRSGLIRVREFTMAEIEYFVDPEDKTHAKFDEVKDLELNLYSACNQLSGESASKKRLEDAVASKTIANETLAYFMARIHLFLVKVGIDSNRLRFRQHMSNEMAHYACDCWDAECLTSYGWVECVGCADRSCYDLTQHSKSTNVKLAAEKRLPEPITVDSVEIQPNKQVIGKEYKQKAKTICDVLTRLSNEEIIKIEEDLAKNCESKLRIAKEEDEIVLKSNMVTIKKGKKQLHVKEIVPSVIEPSFGIGRIMYSIWEHNFRTRENDEQRTFIALPPIIAPLKCSILPLSNNQEFQPFIKRISDSLRKAGVSFKVDDSSGSIGKRYARTDEISIPFGVTIDFDTIKEDTVTLRERDSTLQIRLPIEKVADLVVGLSNETITWKEAMETYPQFEQQTDKNK